MTRPLKLGLLVTCNWLFWGVMFALTWHGLIPERWIVPSFLAEQLFAWPLGWGCCSLWLLVNAQLHETGWRLALTAGVMLVNGVLWAWCVDELWQRVSAGRDPLGFPVIRAGADDDRDDEPDPGGAGGR